MVYTILIHHIMFLLGDSQQSGDGRSRHDYPAADDGPAGEDRRLHQEPLAQGPRHGEKRPFCFCHMTTLLVSL